MRASELSNFLRSNVLLDGLLTHRSASDWFEVLSQNPFREVDIASIDPIARNLLPALVKDSCFVPTGISVRAAQAIYNMLIRGLMDRHPRNEAFKRLPIEIAKRRDQALEAAMFPWLRANARGVLIEGIHGTGKTHLILRILSLLPQVIDRGEIPELGVKAFKQLVYLVIPMPTDASKSGFVTEGFRAIDRVLGTDYYEKYRHLKTVELQINSLINVLLIHRCGMLVIEESQSVHELGTARFGSDFGAFMLKVMNFGIPLVTIGNPMAFKDLRNNSQVMGRLKSEGHFELHPALDWLDEAWASMLVPVLTSITFLPRPDARVRHLPEILWHATGGLPKHLFNIRRGTLEVALLDDADRVTRQHIKGGIEIARGYGDLELIRMLAARDANIETRTDVPGADFRALWEGSPLPARNVPEDFYA